VRLEAVPPERFPAPIEAAVHRLVVDAVRCAERSGDGRAVSVRIAREAAAVCARVVVPGVGATAAGLRLEHAADRIAALDGELVIRADTSGAVCEARVPCAS
jgi:signal transduction histidine kinase